MRRKLEDKNTRKISKHGGSYSVTLPIELVRELGWRDNQKIVIKRVRGGLNIKYWKK
jgi:antitoxin component of MazEF toxin-antitoxin module